MLKYLFGLIMITSCSEHRNNKKTDFEPTTNENHPVDSLLHFKGEAIFITDCNTCHGGRYKTDNYLEGVVQRAGPDYLKLYLTRQDSLVQVKDSNAIMLKKIWGNLANSHNFNYTDEELEAIIEFLK